MSVCHIFCILVLKVFGSAAASFTRDLYTMSAVNITTNEQLKTSTKSNEYPNHRFDHVKSSVLSLGTI